MHDVSDCGGFARCGRDALVSFASQCGSSGPVHWRVITIERIARPSSAGDASFKFLPYQLSMVGSGPTMVVTGNGELGFDSGEGAREMATTSKEGSRRANYPLLTRGGSDNK